MPRLDHQIALDALFSYQEQMMFTLLLDQLNVIRQHVGLPLLTPHDMRQEARAYLRDHPRTKEGG